MGYTHGMKWSDELVKEEIKKVMDSLGINRMPSMREIKVVTHNDRLNNKIAKTGGFYKWAKCLHIPIKKSETYLGKHYEELLMNGLMARGWKIRRMTTKYPYDLLVNENIKIDVKASRRYYYNGKKYSYTFNLEKKNPTCDIYVCFCIDDAEDIEKILVIPSKFLHQTQLSIGNTSAYDKYIARWDYLKEYDDFYKRIA